MAQNFLNKNSQYVQSLVDFILDTKPYHSKLTETVEEYQFFDNVNVKIEERLLSRTKIDSTWLYNYYSSENPAQRTMPLGRVYNPMFSLETAAVGATELEDLAGVPFVYSKKNMVDHIGPSAVFIRRADNSVEPLQESVDFYTSHGSYQFQIKQTQNTNQFNHIASSQAQMLALDADVNDTVARADLDKVFQLKALPATTLANWEELSAALLNPLYTATNDEGIVAAATAKTRAAALDVTKPQSAVNRVRALLNAIQIKVNAHPNVAVQTELDKLFAIIDVPNLPQSYEALLNNLELHPEIDVDEQFYKDEFQKLSSPLFFYQFSDTGIRESGLVHYPDVITEHLKVTEIQPDYNGAYEEWILISMPGGYWNITGSTSGFIGTIASGESFFSIGKISFKTTDVSLAPVGTKVSLIPDHKITIHKSAPLETWNLIKVNSIAHNRAQLVSDSYGKIQNLAGVTGLVTLIDQAIPTTTIILEAREGGLIFDLSSTEDLNHQGVVTVNQTYNDGRVGFKIVTGVTPFRKGDRFYIAIENKPPSVVDIDLGYGYDLDPYDGDDYVYNNTDPTHPDYNRKIGFWYDGRFTDFDPASMNLQITEEAVSDRKWRLRAMPGTPMGTMKKDGSGPSYAIDLQDRTSGIAPDPSLTALPKYAMQSTVVSLYVYIALDLSGSMDTGTANGQTRLRNMLTAVDAALLTIAEAVASGTLIDIMVVGWGDYPSTRSSIMYRGATSANIAAVRAWVANRTTAYGTYFPAGVQDLQTFMAAGDPAIGRRLAFFITDGEPSSSSSDTPLQMAQAARALVVAAAAATGVEVHAVNIDLPNTQYTALVDNTSGDGVPVINGANPTALTSVILAAIGNANSAPDLYLFYATQFAVEYSDDGFATLANIGTINVGETFTSEEQGLSFTLPVASKPYVAVSSNDGVNQDRVEGGDVFSFTIKNPFPELIDIPIGLTSQNVPRLLLHSDSFYEVDAAHWSIAFTTPTDYVITATKTDGTPVSGTPFTGTLDDGLSFKGLGIHFTVVPKPRIYAGDTFVFETFEEKPSYLVHGSLTGWTPPAKVGKYYWNGKIGFKITLPEWDLYVDDTRIVDHSTVGFAVNRVREDVPSLTYMFAKTAAGYMVSRTDIGVQGFVPATGSYSDKYITVTLDGVTEDELKLDINAHQYPLFNAQDVIIVKPKITVRNPRAGDKVIIEKPEAGHLSISLSPSSVSIDVLKPITIDQRFIDIDTGHEIPLGSTSPYANVLQGFLPTYATHYDSPTSIAEFRDPATRIQYRSAATGEIIGLVRPQTANPDEPIVFEWDLSFYNSFLPLNAEANIITMGTGWNDQLHARVTESIKFLIGGGALEENYLFREIVHVGLVESQTLNVKLNWQSGVDLIIQDGPFEGFLPGWDNLEYDNEPVGYDEGQAPDLQSLLAKYALSDEELKDILSRWNNFLQDPNNPPSTAEQWQYFYDQLGLDPNPGLQLTNINIGIPSKGAAFDILDRSADASSTSIQEAAVMVARDYGNPHDMHPYDWGLLDAMSDEIAAMFTGMPPIPAGTIPAGTTYATLDTPLTASVPARVFEINFSGSPSALAALNPNFSIWIPGAQSPQPVPNVLVTKLGPGRYRFSIPGAVVAKILVDHNYSGPPPDPVVTFPTVSLISTEVDSV